MTDQVPDVRWLHNKFDPDAKPHQYYFHNKPVRMLFTGMREQGKPPVGHKLQGADGAIITVFYDEDGKIPGLEFATYTDWNYIR